MLNERIESTRPVTTTGKGSAKRQAIHSQMHIYPPSRPPPFGTVFVTEVEDGRGLHLEPLLKMLAMYRLLGKACEDQRKSWQGSRQVASSMLRPLFL